jgi:hypothetical protein
MPVWALDSQKRFILLPWLRTFARDEQPVSLDDHPYDRRIRSGQVDPEQVLLNVFQDVHRRKPIGLSIAFLARRNRREWSQKLPVALRCHCIHSYCMGDKVPLVHL